MCAKHGHRSANGFAESWAQTSHSNMERWLMGKLLSFPVEKSKKMTVLQKREAKKFALTLSIFSILVMAITLNEKMNLERRPQYIVGGADRIGQLNRAIASAQPLDFVEDVQGEHELIRKLNVLAGEEFSAREPASLGVRPSRTDQLRYGQLAGKYRIAQDSERIKEIQYVDSSDVTDRPVTLPDAKNFLTENKDLFSVHFDKAEAELTESKTQVFRLFDSNGQSVGRAAFEFDEAGHLLSLKVQDK
jgi:hypothetical protein